jgi:hypothetical protein
MWTGDLEAGARLPPETRGTEPASLRARQRRAVVMGRRMSREVASIGTRLVDEAYVSWCTAQLQCQTVLREWFDAGPRDRAEANSIYRVALDREQAAARDLEWLSRLAHAA